MCLGSVCDRVFNRSPFVLRGGILVELQTLKTVPSIQLKVFSTVPCRAWLGGWGYVLHSCIGVGELEPLHDSSHVRCLFVPLLARQSITEEAQRERTSMRSI